MIDFGNTKRGAKFYDADVPKFLKLLERLVVVLEKIESNLGPGQDNKRPFAKK